MPLAYSYIRFSTAEQGKGDSKRRQVELSQKYAAEHGLTLDHSLHLYDRGVSAFDRSNIDRGALGDFLEAINEGRIQTGSYLLVESLDRLSREKVIAALEVFISILNKGITIVTLGDNKVYSAESVGNNFSDLIISITIMARAHEESATKSRRIRAAWENKRNNIGVKKLTAQCPKWMKLNNDKTEFELIHERVELVMEIIDWHKQGFGQAIIAKILNEKAIPTFSNRGNGWHASYIQKMVTSTALYGAYQSHSGSGATLTPRGDIVEKYYPAVISKEEFLLLQNLRVERRSPSARAKKGTKVSNLLSGLVKCGYCSGSMILLGGSPKLVKAADGSKVKIRAKKFLVCDNARRGLNCYAVQWAYSDFEKSFLMFCQSSHLRKLLADAHTDAKQKKRELSTRERHQSNLAAMAECEKKIENLISSLESGIGSKTIVDRIKKLEDDLDKLKELNDQLSIEIASNAMFNKNIKAKYNSMKGLIEKLDSLDEDKILDVRSALAQHFRQNLIKVIVYPAGWRESYRQAEAMRNTMNQLSPENTELTNSVVDQFLKETGAIEPKRKGNSPKGRYDIGPKTDRAFTIIAKNGGYRVVLPNFDNPLKVTIASTPTHDLF